MMQGYTFHKFMYPFMRICRERALISELKVAEMHTPDPNMRTALSLFALVLQGQMGDEQPPPCPQNNHRFFLLSPHPL